MTRPAPDRWLNSSVTRVDDSLPRVGDHRPKWSDLVLYGVAAGTVAAGMAQVLGGLGEAITGRRTYVGAVLQILGVVVVIGLAGLVGDRVVGAARRRVIELLRR
jgi:hypothetical protein